MEISDEVKGIWETKARDPRLLKVVVHILAERLNIMYHYVSGQVITETHFYLGCQNDNGTTHLLGTPFSLLTLARPDRLMIHRIADVRMPEFSYVFKRLVNPILTSSPIRRSDYFSFGDEPGNH